MVFNECMKWNHWVIVGLGGWLIISPWLLGFAAFNLAVWNALVIGALIIVFIFWNFSPPKQL